MSSEPVAPATDRACGGPRDVLEWAGGAEVVRPLAGGTHAQTVLLRVGEREVVLRRFPVGDAAARREAVVLRGLAGLGGRAPELVAVDEDGSATGAPSVLISRLPGRAELDPVDPLVAAAQLGRALALVHGVTGAWVGGLRDGFTAARAEGSGPAAGEVAAGVGRLAGQPQVLTHFDFWTGNALWQDGELTGVVDWSGAARAPRGLDVSWCRLDLALLHGPAAAESFLAAYQEAAGAAVAELRLWDLFALTNSHRSVETWVPNYRDLGRADLTAAELRTRHTAWGERRLAGA
ncbi:hypothetical protein CFP65_1579 [Kitasatospora sp. MMS16-BH015]|uniref:phosphotransferase family protein n=1 Tax=Kitasatospora sp. MMS16-BH015 TaxID=2018025 RepID=UPI000CA150BF|nr:aminoglycoside phosphotransferase family protein [Kitasatospora sp. MMS16-BH015]AUG76467.1 hypothetical protein CFP65_1579 [Kitasatospora sp. MMS16-BH015]